MNNLAHITDLEVQENCANKTNEELIELILKLVSMVRRLSQEILFLRGEGGH